MLTPAPGNFPNDGATPLAGWIPGIRTILEFDSNGSAEVVANPAPSTGQAPVIRIGAGNQDEIR